MEIGQRTSRLKIALVERNKTGKRLAEALNMNAATIGSDAQKRIMASTSSATVAVVAPVEIVPVAEPVEATKPLLPSEI
ncbi:MAG: hypothetical protein LBJ60_04325 [Tannerellaceae bacterium]|nr:hypothetical protein [Tannerellaceae bacterium]